MLRKCKVCGVEAENEEGLYLFAISTTSLYGRRPLCKKCKSKNDYLKYNINVEKQLNNSLKHKYGISIKQYNELFEEQNGCCAICGKHQTVLDRRLCVDHNHKTENIRGLLCQHCNSLLGFAFDNKEILEKAINYLNKFN